MTVRKRRQEPIPLHRLLKEVYKHYLEFRDHFSKTGAHVIEHSYYIYEPDNETIKDKITVSISFLDLRNGLNELSPRKRQAFFYNVILDKRQQEVATIMGITPVTVGQYSEYSCMQLAENYFSDAEFAEHKRLTPKEKKNKKEKRTDRHDSRSGGAL